MNNSIKLKIRKYLNKKDIFELTNFIYNSLPIGINCSGTYILSDLKRLEKISNKLFKLGKVLYEK